MDKKVDERKERERKKTDREGGKENFYKWLGHENEE
jgi:hypothetical protein